MDKEKKRILIYGSCVTRDIFRLFSENFELVDYYARSSLVSLMSELVPIIEDDIGLDSAFQRRMVAQDFNKTLLSRLKNQDYDFLLMDFIDERMSIIELPDGRYVTWSNELANSHYLDLHNIEHSTIARRELDLDIWTAALDKYLNYVLDFLPPEKIILIKGMWAAQYVSKDGEIVNFTTPFTQNYIRWQNRNLEKYYQKINTALGENQLIASPDRLIADENHQWGLSPFNYIPTWYEDVYTQLLEKIGLISSEEEELPSEAKDSFSLKNKFISRKNKFINKGVKEKPNGLSVLENEKVFKGTKDIRYLFVPSKSNSKYLAVVFSAFGSLGIPPVYNYVRTLETLDINKLYIMDEYGVVSPEHPIGCYFLGENRNFTVESSVIDLIRDIAAQNSITFNNIIGCGSSKGGTAALYFGIKYGFGHVISGGPQIFIGKYLFGIDHAVAVGKYIAGGDSEEDHAFLNSILPNIVEEATSFPNIILHVSSTDHHYRGHVLPFTRLLGNKGTDYTLDLQNYPDGHYALGKYFKEFILNTLSTITDKGITLLSKRVEELNNNTYRFTIEAESASPLKYAWYILKDGAVLEKIWYADENVLEYTFATSGRYEVEFFIRNEIGEKFIRRFEEIVIDSPQ